MKLKIVIVEVEIPARVKKWAVRIGLPLVILTIAAVAFAAPLHTWNQGDGLKAVDLNGNFSNLQGQVTTQEGTLSTLQGQVTSLKASVAGDAGPGLDCTSIQGT